jgi:NDP-sugar pyrophosphorylase family protein
MKEKISITLNNQLLKRVDATIDRLFVRNRSQAIEVLLKKHLENNKQAVMIFKGPKERLFIGEDPLPAVNIKGIPLIERTIRRLRQDNFKEIYIIGEKIILESIFSILKTGAEYGVKIKYVEEKESDSTASALKLVRKDISGTFLFVYGDILFDRIPIKDLWDFHIKNNSIATLSLITFDKPSLKGQVFLSGNKIVKFDQKPKEEEKQKKSYLVWCPIAVCEPEIFHYSGNVLERDIFPVLAKRNLLGGYVCAERDLHIHNKKDLAEANKNPKIK